MAEQVMEYKAAASQFKAEGDQGIYEGHFSVFENVDDGMDVIHPGAFAETLVKRAGRIKVFYAHDWDKLIGPTPETLVEDDTGLYAKGRLSLGTFWGREVWELMKDGALTEGSIGYRAKDYEYREDGIRHLMRVDLFEISPVPLGMNPLTELRVVKTALGLPPEAQSEALLKSVETLAALLEEIKSGRLLVTATAEQKAQVADGLEGVAEAASAPVVKDAVLRRRLRVAELALRL